MRRRLPADAVVLPMAQTRVLMALLRVFARDGRATVRSVGSEAGLASTSSVMSQLGKLRRAGWAEWDEGRQGSLRPTYRAVPFG